MAKFPFFQKKNNEEKVERPSEKNPDKKQDPKKDDKKKKEQLKRPKPKKIARKVQIKGHFEKAGIDIDGKLLLKITFNTSIAVNLFFSLLLIYHFSASYGISWGAIVTSVFLLWTLGFVAIFYLSWLVFYIIVDLKIYKRKVEIEEVLPDFLQLTASNITAGMTIDRALWFAVRPRFGVLAREIEMIAKSTMSGAELRTELEKFADRFDSPILKRSIAMLNEGIEAGGKIGDLLNRIALDIQEQTAMLKEMAANVTTYVIFIGFATIAAAPMLFALSGVLISVVGAMGENLGDSLKSAAAAGLPFSFSGAGVTKSDFKIFAILSLSLSSVFASMMISTIKKGNVKHGLRYIPVFILVSLSIYLVVQSVGSKLFSFMF